MVRFLLSALVLPGCGLVVGLRTDYELGDQADAGKDSTADVRADAETTDTGSETNACDGAQCCDGKKNGAETDVDCGGGVCPKCANGQDCKQHRDCASDKCGNNDRCRN